MPRACDARWLQSTRSDSDEIQDSLASRLLLVSKFGVGEQATTSTYFAWVAMAFLTSRSRVGAEFESLDGADLHLSKAFDGPHLVALLFQ